ncbi:response regulator [Spiribacter sp. C176]|uniref:Response regulator n=1 Tax=Spiribacter salilacus TaxID=2664894 RepID=A0A6N7R051_9GAMM|nr:response regulator transcription factor [Spiribacter salilacus]MRH78284.1 response regulator [Spiribacter salilacus]
MQDVLILEDEKDLRDTMVEFMQSMGHDAIGVGSVEEADAWLTHQDARVLVVDLTLPGEGGLSWLRRRPELKERGIIMVTAAGSDNERIAGRLAGADSYFVKPVNLVELGMSVKNLTERLAYVKAWQLDSLTWTLTAPHGDSIKLTASERRFMEALAMTPGIAVNRHDIILRLGEDPKVYDQRRLEILVRRLRSKITDSLNCDPPISTARSVGYAFTSDLEWVE